MPIYEYKCQQCGTHFEKRQSVSDKPLATCEKCHGKLEKQWSLSGFQFKGGGWYVTDYAGKKPDTSPSTASDSSAPAEKTSSTESTVKTESASNTKSDTSSSKKETT